MIDTHIAQVENPFRGAHANRLLERGLWPARNLA
jgi:hypothetical protein